jgi:hypothetical protein
MLFRGLDKGKYITEKEIITKCLLKVEISVGVLNPEILRGERERQ